MPNGIVEDRFNFYSFSEKAFWSGDIGTSQEGSHRRIGARCYLLNKLIFNRSNLDNLFFVVVKISGYIMKDVWVINKIGMPGVLFFKKFESLAIGGLGKLFNSSLATENPSFRQLENWTQDYINHQNHIDSVF